MICRRAHNCGRLRKSVALTDYPGRILLGDIFRGLFSQRCCTGEDGFDGAEIILIQDLLVLSHKNDDWRDEIERVDLEVLDGFQATGKLKFRQDHDSVAAKDTGVGYHHQSIYVAHGQESKAVLEVLVISRRRHGVSRDLVVDGDLEYVCYDVCMRYLDSFLG
jgi:hypothetical protein